MYIKSLELADFRNYHSLAMEFSPGTNILYGDNAQGKTNILEALYMIATTRSHRGVRDRDLIRFGREEAHIRTVLMKKDLDYQVDMHLRSGKSKGIAINGQRIRRASELVGLLHIIFFSPEDLAIVKNGPAERRRFMDMELCQLDAEYLYNAGQYNKIVENRNKLLRQLGPESPYADMLDVWDEQLLTYGTKIIERRAAFIDQLNTIITELHAKLSGGREHLTIAYEPQTTAEDFARALHAARGRDLFRHSTGVGPHRDDFSFIGDGIDLRRYGSQGQQRTCALSLKLSEIELVRSLIGDSPVLMLDDVLSELDSSRQNYLLSTIGGIQTFITCTGLDEFVSNRFEIDQLYHVVEGTAQAVNDPQGLNIHTGEGSLPEGNQLDLESFLKGD